MAQRESDGQEQNPILKGFKDLRGEVSRIYVFPGGDQLVVENPVQLRVTASGHQRLVDADGNSYIIAPGWLYIRFKVKPGQPPFSF